MQWLLVSLMHVANARMDCIVCHGHLRSENIVGHEGPINTEVVPFVHPIHLPRHLSWRLMFL